MIFDDRDLPPLWDELYERDVERILKLGPSMIKNLRRRGKLHARLIRTFNGALRNV